MDPLTIALIAGGTILSAYGTLAQGRYAMNAGKIEAQQLRRQGMNAFASSQRTAQDIQLETDLLASKALATAAASGAGASDPTVLNIIARISGEGAYRKSVALYEGKVKNEDLNYQAWQAETGGQQALRASRIGAAGSLLQGGASLYSKYNPGKTTNPGGVDAGAH